MFFMSCTCRRHACIIACVNESMKRRRRPCRTLHGMANRYVSGACLAAFAAGAACGSGPPDTPAWLESPAVDASQAPAGASPQLTAMAPNTPNGSLVGIVLEQLSHTAIDGFGHACDALLPCLTNGEFAACL